MKHIPYLFLCTAVIILMMTAGCTFGKTGGPNPLVTETATIPATPPATPAITTTQPAAAGTTSAATCPADVSSDPANCGGCGMACPANALCQQGQCYCKEGYAPDSSNQCSPAAASTGTGNGCPAEMNPCPDGYCYDLTSDAAHCGTCTNTCPAGMACSASTCASTAPPVTTTAVVTTTTTSSGPAYKVPTTLVSAANACLILGLTKCNGACVNTTTDSENCGSCGTKCTGPLMGCCNGVCKSFASDSANCGSCGHKCGITSTCVSGSCKVKTVITGVAIQTYMVPKVTITIPIYQQKPGIPGF